MSYPKYAPDIALRIVESFEGSSGSISALSTLFAARHSSVFDIISYALSTFSLRARRKRRQVLSGSPWQNHSLKFAGSLPPSTSFFLRSFSCSSSSREILGRCCEEHDV